MPILLGCTSLKIIKPPFPFVNKQLIGCVIVPLNITSSDDLVPITTLKNHCSQLPLIIYGKVVDDQRCVELGKIGIEAYFETDMMKELVAKLQGIIEQRKFKIDFSQFGIDVEQCPMTIRRALNMYGKGFFNYKNGDRNR